MAGLGGHQLDACSIALGKPSLVSSINLEAILDKQVRG